jgi:hypothetical protein
MPRIGSVCQQTIDEPLQGNPEVVERWQTSGT